MGENILVVRSAELREHFDFQGFLQLSGQRVQEFYDSVDVRGMERDLAETDPTFKQLVAYSVVRRGDQFLTYLRGKDLGEARLHGNRSIGIGGHIERKDHQFNLFLDDHLKAAAIREIDEEIIISDEYDLVLTGLLNDDSNDVGSVHLGLVYLVSLEGQEVNKRERGIAQMKFDTMDELRSRREQFETWSQILIDNIEAFL
jgi:predicted NUDIX family phosphoesterase